MNTLSVISFILEAVGMSIVLFNMRFPRITKRLENFIDISGDELHVYAHKHHKDIWYQIAFSIMLLSVLIVGAGSIFSMITFPFWSWLIFWVSLVLGGSMIVISLLGDFIALLNKFSVYDQAMTTLGFFLAVCGLIIEAGQLLNLF